MQTLSYIVDLVLPHRCPGCGQPTAVVRPSTDEVFCAICADSIEPCVTPLCSLCGVPLPRGTRNRRCGECLADPLPISSIRAPFLYGGAMAQALLRLKRLRSSWVAAPLGRMLARAATDAGLVDVIVPVPLHPSTLRRRGYNQAALLAVSVGKRIERPMAADLLVRVRETEDQRSLAKAARQRSVERAFDATAKGRETIKGRRILLIDDVVTTGATVTACAKAILREGAREVAVLAMARTPPPWW